MSTVLTIIAVVFIFSLFIIVHELGHLFAAKKLDVKVNEFAIGMGPTIWSTQRGETTYALRALPIGGFVSMEGEDEESHDPRSFGSKKAWQKSVILSAGAAMNLLFGYLLMLGFVLMSPSIATTEIYDFYDGAVSSQYLQAGDVIVGINGQKIRTSNSLNYALISDDDGIYEIEVLRSGERVLLPRVAFLTEEYDDGTKELKLDFRVKGLKKTLANVLLYALDWSYETVKLVWASLLNLASGNFSIRQLSGPVGVGVIISKAFSLGLDEVFIRMAMITINIGIFNLLPIPAMDGGRLLFILIEKIRRKPMNPKIEDGVNFVGFSLLMGLMLVVMFFDTIKVFFNR